MTRTRKDQDAVGSPAARTATPTGRWQRASGSDPTRSWDCSSGGRTALLMRAPKVVFGSPEQTHQVQPVAPVLAPSAGWPPARAAQYTRGAAATCAPAGMLPRVREPWPGRGHSHTAWLVAGTSEQSSHLTLTLMTGLRIVLLGAVSTGHVPGVTTPDVTSKTPTTGALSDGLAAEVKRQRNPQLSLSDEPHAFSSRCFQEQPNRRLLE